MKSFSKSLSTNGLPLLLIVLAGSLAACAPIVGVGQSAVTDLQTYVLTAGTTIGQTFVPHQAGMMGVEVYLAPREAGDGQIVLRLHSDPEAIEDIDVATMPLSRIQAPAFYRFEFAPRPESRQTYYYAQMEVLGAGSVLVGSAPGDTHLDGAMYLNGDPLDAQASFQLAYEPRYVYGGLAREAIAWLGFLVVAVFLYVIPGWALLTALWPDFGAWPWPAKLGLATGVSLSIAPVLMLWTDLVGLHLGPLYAWLPPLSGLGFLVWRHRRVRLPQLRQALGAWRGSGVAFADLAFVAIAGLIFLVRFYVVRPFEAPMWADSVSHTLIVQLIADHGGLFDSWEPYADLRSFTYHFGFHAATANFLWITRLPAHMATLWSAQVLNGLAAIVVYPLAWKLGGGRWGGTAAVLIAGLLSPMPMYYVNWGRYTQLAGQVILPAAVLLTWAQVERGNSKRSLVIVGAVTWAGLALTHYRVFVFAAAAIPALLLVSLRRSGHLHSFARVTMHAVGTMLLFAPWAVQLTRGQLPSQLVAFATTPPSQTPEWLRVYNSAGDLATFLPAWIWLLAGCALALGLWRREPGIVTTGLWWFLLVLAANPDLLSLPGEGAISNFAMLLAAYIPVSAIVGAFLGWTSPGAQRTDSTRGAPPLVLARVALFLGLLVIAFLGAMRRLGDLQRLPFTLLTRPDTRAAEWIDSSLPNDARFLVDHFFLNGGTWVVGSDGGSWLPYLSWRKTTIPPGLYSVEAGLAEDYRARVNNLAFAIRDQGISNSDTLKMLRDEWKVTHIYLGQQQGKANMGNPNVLAVEDLLSNPHLRVVYQQDRVWIFEILN